MMFNVEDDYIPHDQILSFSDGRLVAKISETYNQ